MTEFTKGIQAVFVESSLALALIYTLGHICIATVSYTHLTLPTTPYV